MALVWLEFVYFEAPELKREGINLDHPLGIGSLTYIGATAAPLSFEVAIRPNVEIVQRVSYMRVCELCRALTRNWPIESQIQTGHLLREPPKVRKHPRPDGSEGTPQLRFLTPVC